MLAANLKDFFPYLTYTPVRHSLALLFYTAAQRDALRAFRTLILHYLPFL